MLPCIRQVRDIYGLAKATVASNCILFVSLVLSGTNKDLQIYVPYGTCNVFIYYIKFVIHMFQILSKNRRFQFGQTENKKFRSTRDEGRGVVCAAYEYNFLVFMSECRPLALLCMTCSVYYTTRNIRTHIRTRIWSHIYSVAYGLFRTMFAEPELNFICEGKYGRTAYYN